MEEPCPSYWRGYIVCLSLPFSEPQLAAILRHPGETGQKSYTPSFQGWNLGGLQIHNCFGSGNPGPAPGSLLLPLNYSSFLLGHGGLCGWAAPSPQCQACARLRVFFQVSLGTFYVKGDGTILATCDFPRSAGCLFEVNLAPSAAVAHAICCKSHQLRVLLALCEKQENKRSHVGVEGSFVSSAFALYLCILPR